MHNDFVSGALKGGKQTLIALAICAVGSQVFQSDASAQIVILNDGNSSATVDTAGAGLVNWSIDGQNQINQQSFHYRVGAVGPEAYVSSISAPIIVQPDGKTLNLSYQNSQFNIQLIYSLLGGSPGSGASDISEQIRIQNLTASTLDFHFFQYVDFDLLGAGGDSVSLGKNLQNKFNEAFQTDGVATFAETVTAPGANHGEVSMFNLTLTKLTDGVATTLDDSVTVPGTGNVTWALQWDFSIAAGKTVIISKDLNVIVPEPSSFAIGTLGLLALGFMRRRNRK